MVVQRPAVFVLCLLAAVCSCAGYGGPGKVFRDTWYIVTKNVNADCMLNRPTVLVNYRLPGPLINVLEGTRIEIKVVNKQKHPMTIHWHGIKQEHTQWSDGVGGVTQCGIEMGKSFTYNFSTEGHAGNLWWHAHVAMLRHTVMGGLIIHPRPGGHTPGRKPPPVPIAGETLLLLSDWFEGTSESLEAGVLGYPFAGFPSPDTLLINGATRTTCSNMFTFTVQPMKWYFLRVTNGALYATLNFAVQHHNIYTYESEGGYLTVQPFTSYDIMSGQSYTFLLHANQAHGAYYFGARPRYDIEGYGGKPGLALLKYSTTPNAKPILRGRGFYNGPTVYANPYFTWGQLVKTKGSAAAEPWARKVDYQVVLQVNMHSNYNAQKQQVVRYSINNVSTEFPTIPPLFAHYAGIPGVLHPGFMPSTPKPGASATLKPSKTGFGVIPLPYNKTIQMVFQNHVPPGLNHPFHLHGHNFYIVAQGWGEFDWKHWNKYKYNLVNPVYRNTAWLLEGGWTVIRFRTDNPGTWIMHCHLEPHVDGGMMAIFDVSKPGGGAIPPVPSDYPNCGGVLQPYLNRFQFGQRRK